MADEKKMTILEHLGELRKVLIISLIATAIASVVGWIYSERILAVLTAPIKALKYELIVLSVTEALFTKLKVAVFAGVILALPVILYQLWTFMLPALKTSEKKYLRVLVPVSFILFVSGVLFAFKFVFPIGVKVLLTTFVVPGITPMVSLTNYLSFTMGFLLPFGIIFEMPLIILFLSRLGLVSPAYLREKRKYALLIIFIIAAALTPGPDIISQLLMAAPMYILYEASIWVSRFMYKEREKAGETAEEPGEEEVPPGKREEEIPAGKTGENPDPAHEQLTDPGPSGSGDIAREEQLENILEDIIQRGQPPKGRS